MVDTTIVHPAAGSGREAPVSAVSWAAIIAGAIAAIALSLIMAILGAGLGMTAISPFSGGGASATALGIGSIVWLAVTQWVAAGFGGYLTGRLRTKWVAVHSNEVFFRDTAHGFLSWALATLVTAWLFATVVTGIISGVATTAGNALGAVTEGVAQGATEAVAGEAGSSGYLVDTLFRPAGPGAAGAIAGQPTTLEDARSQAERVLVTSLAAGEISAEDRTYVAQLIAAQTGLSPTDAEARIDEVMAQANAMTQQVAETADQAREGAATLAIVSFLALLIGAFIASALAALAGRQRDDFETVTSRERVAVAR